ncbi:MAG: ribonuclease HII [Candidatus Aenigmatarchaeota archaeon]|nr:MAG: ribonuclease HII [Candidatus Aenigmarchaeota archaeon]
MKVLGIDESGRGAVIGPLVIAGVMVDDGDFGELRRIRVKDSKLLSKKRREELYNLIKEISSDFIILQIPPGKVDKARERNRLNRLEVEHFAEIINTLKPDRAIVDSPEANTEKIRREIESKLKCDVEVIAENKADRKYPVVSAASILAKVVRDRSIEALEKELGEKIGVGYPSDERTMEFLRKILTRDGEFPDFVRKSWITAKRLNGEKKQRKISDY